MTGRELDYIAEAHRERAPFRRRPVHEALPRLARDDDRRAQGAADPLVHGRARDGRAAARSRARRRSHHALVHVRLDGERVRAARRDAGVRRHPRRHAQHRRTPDRGRDHAAHAGDLRRALRRRRLRDGRDRRRSPQRHGLPIVEDAAQGSSSTLPRPAARRDRRARRAELPRDQERHLRRRRRAARQRRRASSSAPRSSARKAPTAAQFFRGQVDKYTWVDVGSSYLPSEIIAAFLCGAARRGASASRASGSRSGSATTRRSRRSKRAGLLAPADRARALPAQRAHVLRAAGRSCDADTRSSQRCAAPAFIRSSTTCRCTARRPGVSYGRLAATSR